MRKFIIWPQRKPINGPLDLYAYIAYLTDITFIICSRFLPPTACIILAIATILINLVALVFTYSSEKDKQRKEQKT